MTSAITGTRPQTCALKQEADYLAPDGSEIRLLPSMTGGGLAHCTLPAGKVSLAVAHKRVEEIWYVIEGQGEVWRRTGGTHETTALASGISITIPPGTGFQFRNTGSEPLRILIATMPPWPGPQEAYPVEGQWEAG